MTEIAVRQDATVSIIQTSAQDMTAANRLAVALVNTAFVPAHFKGKPDDATAAIMYGAAIGLDPLASLQNIYVISGRPAMYARAMMAVVLSHGHEIWTEESGPTKVVVCGKRKGSDHIERSEWTYDRARKAGYTSNKKYDTEPEAMLYARASGDVARHVAPDALLGMAYSVEELEQSPTGPDGVPAITAVKTGADRLREAIGAAPAQEPVRATAERGASKEQVAELNALMEGRGVTSKAGKLSLLSEQTGRQITSSAELTDAEADALIAALQVAEAIPDEDQPDGEPTGADDDAPPPPDEPEWPDVPAPGSGRARRAS